MKRTSFIVLMLSMCVASVGCLAKSSPQIITDDDIIQHFCSPANNINWVIGDDECLRITTIKPDQSPSVDKLIVYLHGDGSGAKRPSDYLQRSVEHISQDNVAHIILMRPGYFDSTGHYSTGKSHRNSWRATSYNAHNVKEIAAVIRKLKTFHQAEQVILVGHSGGAALAALILGKHPDVADGAVLAACPCDVNKWVEMAGTRSGRGALSPIDYVDHIKPDVAVIALTGTLDNNTRPPLAIEYIEKLRHTTASNHRAVNKSSIRKYIGVKGQTHNGVARSPQFYQAINELIADSQ